MYHIIRENDYNVNTLTQKISLSHHNTVDGYYRYKGKAEKWYSYTDKDENKEVEFDHVWLDKINTQKYTTQSTLEYAFIFEVLLVFRVF